MDPQKVKEFWLEEAEESLSVAWHLFEKTDYSYSLFFGHLAIEKLLKAVFVIKKGEQATFNKKFHYVDLADQEKFLHFKQRYQDLPVIVLNLTKKGALAEYIPHFWTGVVFINEVYPEPSRAEVEVMRSKGVICYHIAGIKAKAWPAFPRGYQGGIPCCASFLPEKEGDGLFEVIVREMG
jgi:hypothetical protein